MQDFTEALLAGNLSLLWITALNLENMPIKIMMDSWSLVETKRSDPLMIKKSPGQVCPGFLILYMTIKSSED